MSQRLDKFKTRCNTPYAPTGSETGREKQFYTWNPSINSCDEITARRSKGSKKNLFNSNEQCVSACTRKIEFYETAIAELQEEEEPSVNLKSALNTADNTETTLNPFCDTNFEAGFSGTGAASSERWFYNSNVGACEIFTYLGFGGNENNYRTQADCQNSCIPVCFQPKEVGPCRAMFNVYYYNAEKGECERFGYGGCFGNSNRFPTKSQCENFCLNSDEMIS